MTAQLRCSCHMRNLFMVLTPVADGIWQQNLPLLSPLLVLFLSFHSPVNNYQEGQIKSLAGYLCQGHQWSRFTPKNMQKFQKTAPWAQHAKPTSNTWHTLELPYWCQSNWVFRSPATISAPILNLMHDLVGYPWNII